MKYEAVFGDQRLFKDCSENAILVISDLTPTAPTVEFFSDDKLNFETVDVDSRRIKVAMRRIIAEPKRWTAADQKAGRLPDVGCVVRATGVNEDARIAAINNDSVCVVFEDGAFVTLHVSGIAPIGTPEEKAQREEDEFVDSESFFIDVCTMSGPMKAAYKQGARAAYRKLKGGE